VTKHAAISTNCPFYTDELGHVDDVPLDPSQDETYDVVLGVFEELVGPADGSNDPNTALIPDLYVHIGGDEVKYGCWNESIRIRTFMAEHGMAEEDFRALEEYYYTRIAEKLAGYDGDRGGHSLGKKMVAWEEIFFDGSGGTGAAHNGWAGSKALPPSITVMESWTGPDYMEEAMTHGYDSILAYGFYLDRQTPVDGSLSWEYMDSWAQMYNVEPEPLDENGQASTNVAPDAPKGVRGSCLGGEASVWTENMDAVNIDSMTWPRGGAAAERLWSQRDIKDPAAAVTRLELWRCRLVARLGIRAGPLWSGYCDASTYFGSPN